MSDTVQDCWLHPPFAFSPFTSPPVRFRVPSPSISALRKQAKNILIRTYTTDEYSDRLFGLWLLNFGKMLRIKEWFTNLSRSDSSLLSMTKCWCENTELCHRKYNGHGHLRTVISVMMTTFTVITAVSFQIYKENLLCNKKI